MVMVMMSTVLTDTDTGIETDTDTTTAIHQSSLLAEFTAGLVSSQVVEAGKATLAAQAMELAQHVLMFGPVGGHVALEVGALAVEELSADVAVHLVAVVAGGDVFVAHLLVHEGFGTAGERAFEQSLAAAVGLFGLQAVWADDGGGRVGRRGYQRCQMFLRHVPC